MLEVINNVVSEIKIAIAGLWAAIELQQTVLHDLSDEGAKLLNNANETNKNLETLANHAVGFQREYHADKDELVEVLRSIDERLRSLEDLVFADFDDAPKKPINH